MKLSIWVLFYVFELEFVFVLSKSLNAQELNVHFSQFKKDFQRNYVSVEEEKYRKQVFAQNLDFILTHNVQADQGKRSFRLGVNNFTDLSNTEYRSKYIGFTKGHAHLRFITSRSLGRKSKEVPTEFDWTSKEGVVSPVRDQGECRSGWAFAVVATLEGWNAIRNRKFTNLSEQNLIDCAVGSYSNVGCEGGLISNGFWYVKDHGLDLAQSYPPKDPKEQSKCRSKNAKTQTGIQTRGWEGLPQDEKSVKQALYSTGPLAASIDASNPTFQHYKSGIYDEPNCSPDALTNHGITIVGYGTSSNDPDYWKLKNSFGTSWGENGFMRMRRGQDMCGIASQVSYPY